MGIGELSLRYKGRLSFWGGIDTQSLLPYATPANVQKAVENTLELFRQDGGYILAPVHNIQPGVPPENILIMYDTARQAMNS
jgi:uroporphyrinogen decarboxylase